VPWGATSLSGGWTMRGHCGRWGRQALNYSEWRENGGGRRLSTLPRVEVGLTIQREMIYRIL
jgi:hypothetical protein